MTEKANEFEKFDKLASKLLKVPHSQIKAKLDAEKLAKQKRKPKASALEKKSK